MMEHQDKSPYASEPFKFIIDGNPLYIHADLVSLHSKPLDRLINGQMIEAQKRFAVIEDVDEETFTRFIQWAYNRYYSPADFDIIVYPVIPEQPDVERIVDSPSPPAPAGESFAPQGFSFNDVAFDSWSGLEGSSKKASKKGKKSGFLEPPHEPSPKEALKTLFIQRKTKVRQESIPIPPPRPNRNPHEDYTKVFLSHARLYVFADKYDIEPLKALAFDNLHQTLSIYTLYEELTDGIVELLRYVYANSGDCVEGREDMRTLMTDYMGVEMRILMKDEGFKRLMIDDGGALLGDFMTLVGKRIR